VPKVVSVVNSDSSPCGVDRRNGTSNGGSSTLMIVLNGPIYITLGYDDTSS
jgi:hypothetical protein